MSKRCCFRRSQFPVLCILIAVSAYCQYTSQATVAPNEFRFSSARYDVSAEATNAVITVQFTPGHRGVYGWVDYTVRNKTASTNGRYTLVSGTLSFTGYGARTFTVPINRGSPGWETETIELTLSPSQYDQSSIITRSNAVVRIIKDSPVPALKIAPGANGLLNVSWPDDGSNLQLETSAGVSGTDWTAVTTPRTTVNGRCCVAEPSSGTMALYRLRKTQ